MLRNLWKKKILELNELLDAVKKSAKDLKKKELMGID